MKLISFAVEIARRRAEYARYRAWQKKCRAMQTEELNALEDTDLLSAVSYRLDAKVDKFDDISEGLEALSENQRVIYSVGWFDAEIQNGGLCQFFVNSSRVIAPDVSKCLAALNACEYKRLYDGFIEENKIDTCDLSSFGPADISEYERQMERYPFDDFDDSYYKLSEKKPIEAYMIAFVRKSLSEF